MRPTFYINSLLEEVSAITALDVAVIGENDPYIKRAKKTDQKSSASPVMYDVITMHAIAINKTGRLPYRSAIQPQGIALIILPKLYTPIMGAE